MYRRWPTKDHLAIAVDADMRAGTDPVLLLDQLAGAVYYRVLITGAPVDDTYLERLASAALDGALSTKEPR